MSDPTLYLDGRVAVHAGDCFSVIKTLADNSIDACVCDPPYALVSIGKRFAAEGAKLPNGSDPNANPYNRVARGFMQKAWDNGSTAFSVDFWAEVWRVLKPGAHVVAFGGTRTYHRLACAIEDAGFECRDAVMWHYGSGFPKSHSVNRAIDRSAGFARGTTMDTRNGPNTNQATKGDKFGGYPSGQIEIDVGPATDAARAWEGWGTALKPATEIIFVGRKPLSEGTIAANVLRWGTSAINIDACRVPIDDAERETIDNRSGAGQSTDGWGHIGNRDEGVRYKSAPLGRWPANLCHDGSAEVLAAFPDSEAAPIGSVVMRASSKDGHGNASSTFGKESRPAGTVNISHGDSGSAARFFASFPQENECPRCDLCGLLCGWQSDTNQACNANTAKATSQTESILNGDSVPSDAAALRAPEGGDKSNQSSARATNAESDLRRCRPLNGASVLPIALPLPLSRIVRNVRSAANLCDLCATAIAHGLVGPRTPLSLESLPLPDFISERSAQILRQSLALYVEGRRGTDIILTIPSLKQLFGSVFHAIANCTPRPKADDERAITPKQSSRVFYSSKADQDSRLGSKHPTVKPLALMQWLCRLVTPPGGTLLDPFAGTGTTGEAAYREGFNAVLIEREAEYLDDIARRMKYALGGLDERKHVIIKAKGLVEAPGPLFGFLDDPKPAGGADRYTGSSPINSDDRTNGAQMVRTAE